jgi:hypothetical protein
MLGGPEDCGAVDPFAFEQAIVTHCLRAMRIYLSASIQSERLGHDADLTGIICGKSLRTED